MRVTFLGTSHGIPEPHRHCSCIMLEVGENRYFIDAGTSPYDGLKARGISPDSVKAIFITHMHGDHTNGLVSFVDLSCWALKATRYTVYLPEVSACEVIKSWVSAVHDTYRPEIAFAPVSEGLVYDDGIIKVTAMKTGHIPNAYAYIIEAEGKRLLFSGDMKHGDGPISDFARFLETGTFDLAVGECAHFPAELYTEPLRKNPPKRFVITHYSSRFTESVYRFKALMANELNVIIANDDMEISL